ncbi:small ribosomal subunit Rsm22 family protein [Dactylosporangium sp. AC04546]|uniref:small ribosomal subunit Rsm22 family protein n=1 Tax=Dactylosporangium sp. AC04546 TaxID=2862460 RepID=UPI001EDCA33F|nr:small ribosomal subunit Rsm22 family protein [Dactylosporangium sp. AC04546]WVK87879.1 small ribosomal subunit Rsm22 family protein [Dactylosporangium sp. AC04546]
MSDLREALDALLEDVPPARLADSVQRLITVYRSGLPAGEPLLRNMVDATAYAAYRMPATHAAVAKALAMLPPIEPRSLLDVGGGTGAATWAAVGAFGPLDATVLDQVPEALRLGERIAKGRLAAQWREWHLGEPLTEADLITVSYLMTELTEDDQRALVAAAGAAARQALVIVEPGTPEGYRRILKARDELMAAGWTVAAPCPHQGTCGMVGKDWCHFSARINRSALHRRLKDARLGHEDEKFSFVAVTRGGNDVTGRVVRHPAFRKGLVTLQVCQPDTTVGPVLVPKREGARYKAARDAEWGDQWPPHSDDAE